jgi:hypothetical protein
MRRQGVHRVWRPAGEDTGCLWLYAPAERSIATLDMLHNGRLEVEQTGDRQLFNEVEAAYHWWLAQGKPTTQDWTITIHPTSNTSNFGNRPRRYLTPHLTPHNGLDSTEHVGSCRSWCGLSAWSGSPSHPQLSTPVCMCPNRPCSTQNAG